VACVVGSSVKPITTHREIQHVNIILRPRYQFFEQPNMKGKIIELNGKPSSVVTMFSTDFSFQNLVFWEFI
jgi:hypothetical protein